jgi:hypothetical protein
VPCLAHTPWKGAAKEELLMSPGASFSWRNKVEQPVIFFSHLILGMTELDSLLKFFA